MIEALALAAALATSPIDTTVGALRKDVEAFDGQRVRVHGPVICQIPTCRVCADDDPGACLRLDIGRDDPIRPRINGATVTLTARFQAECLRKDDICLDFPRNLFAVKIEAIQR